MDVKEVMQLRFDSSPFPSLISDKPKYYEKIVQWFLELSFFKDYVFRNPEKTKGKEFSDALIIYDDTALILQMKTKVGSKETRDWVEKNLNNAIEQLNGSYRNITQKIVTKFYNQTLQEEIQIDSVKIKNVYGLIVLSVDSTQLDVSSMIKEVNCPIIPVNVFSLNDFKLACERMDTAGDFITYFEMRYDYLKESNQQINNEEAVFKRISENLEDILGPHFRGKPNQLKQKSFDILSKKLIGDYSKSEEYKFSLIVDDIISRVHDLDDKYSNINAKQSSFIVGQVLGYLTRERRIELGKRILNMAEQSRDGIIRSLIYIHPATKWALLVYISKQPRNERRDLIKSLLPAAQIKYKVSTVVIIITEPIGAGRSYDFAYAEQDIFPKGTEVSKDVLDLLPEANTFLFSTMR